MKTLIFAPASLADIDGIYDYSEDNWGFEQAESYTFGLRDACRMIAAGEKRGRQIRGAKITYLALPYRSHYIIYRETSQKITIVRVLHQRMNIARHL